MRYLIPEAFAGSIHLVAAHFHDRYHNQPKGEGAGANRRGCSVAHETESNRLMTLNFQMRREDILAFTREYHSASPTYQRTRMRVRFMLPAIMLCLWLFTFATRGFEWTATVVFLGVAALWYCFYPARFDRRVERYAEKTLDEASHSKCLGPCELTLSEAGLHSKSNTGESTFYWSAVDRVLLTEAYLFIFLTGPIGYPIPIADVGSEAAQSAYDYAISHKITLA